MKISTDLQFIEQIKSLLHLKMGKIDFKLPNFIHIQVYYDEVFFYIPIVI